MCTTLRLRRPALRVTGSRQLPFDDRKQPRILQSRRSVTDTREVFSVGSKGEERFQAGLPDQHHAIPTLIGRADEGVTSRPVELDRPAARGEERERVSNILVVGGTPRNRLRRREIRK